MSVSMWLWAGEGHGRDEGTRPGSGTGRSGEPSRTRVLVVDDDRSILDTVEAILQSEGHQVATASGGHEALALARTWQPTMVLLDMRMPVMDGWAVARAMREAGSTIPIVVMTAAENAQRWADEIGAAGHLAKPFELDDLIACVARFGGERPN